MAARPKRIRFDLSPITYVQYDADVAFGQKLVQIYIEEDFRVLGFATYEDWVTKKLAMKLTSVQRLINLYLLHVRAGGAPPSADWLDVDRAFRRAIGLPDAQPPAPSRARRSRRR